MGLLAAMLAVTGIFGMAAYNVSRRMKELGIRVALGARAKHVISAAVGRPIVLLGLGSLAGLLLGIFASRLLEHIVYQANPVRTVASQSWIGGDQSGPSYSGFFGAVQFATGDDAKAFFAAAADKWHRCNGQTLVLHQPQHGADGLSRITDVVVDNNIVSAIVLHDDGSTIQRALGVASDCVVDVEVTNPPAVNGGDAAGAVGVANLMLQKIGVS